MIFLLAPYLITERAGLAVAGLMLALYPLGQIIAGLIGGLIGAVISAAVGYVVPLPPHAACAMAPYASSASGCRPRRPTWRA